MTEHDDLVSAAKEGSEEARGELIDAFTTRISHVADVSMARPKPGGRNWCARGLRDCCGRSIAMTQT